MAIVYLGRDLGSRAVAWYPPEPASAWAPSDFCARSGSRRLTILILPLFIPHRRVLYYVMPHHGESLGPPASGRPSAGGGR
jgi:hypothetical protein